MEERAEELGQLNQPSLNVAYFPEYLLVQIFASAQSGHVPDVTVPGDSFERPTCDVDKVSFFDMRVLEPV